jgi:hypothetical protein
MPLSPQWLAGFFDGEGCISCTVAGARRRVILRLSLVNTDADLMRRIAVEYKGQFVQRKAPKPHWKAPCHVVWTNTQAIYLLGQIGDYIVLKARQVALAKEFLALRERSDRFEYHPRFENGRGRGAARVVSKVMLQQEEAIKAQFHVLNRKGAAA